MMSDIQIAPVPPVGQVKLGDLGRLAPISPVFGFDRGTPVDRYYVERFLGAYRASIGGRVLEIGDSQYTRLFGGDRVAHSDVLNVRQGVPGTTIVADLADGADLPDEAFDCVIVTQTLHLIYDYLAALRTLFRILKPGAVLLMTSPGTISQLGPGEWGSHWFWGFTPLALRRMFEEIFPPERITVTSHGNVLASLGFLQGMSSQEFSNESLDYDDPRYPLLLTVYAQKAPSPT